ncbi:MULTISPECIES: LTA synthase family protein [unclassified Halomonas]|uniref:LTA synthase family protein n=1 Tax=unclassified Halomonas TaxID=2609666 RepID=UPI001C939356|nr:MULTISPECIES: LTA synthase family protein [unclassified Halomonas]MBY5926533.1 LTA synthase family protein [Halomonas sp. DP4Y7-2]MBY6233754.1 LTA synthase family protein [Halomonas sp. DP4Y7-1]
MLLVSLLLLPLFLGLALSIAMEALVRPRPDSLWLRPKATLMVHIGTWLLLFAVSLLMLQRGWLSAGLLLCLQLVVIESARTKWVSLKEPFLVQDFDYFLDAIRHPRLYVPFFGIGLAIAASVSGALAFAAFLWFEPALSDSVGASGLVAMVAILGLNGVGLLGHALPRLSQITLNPVQDLKRHGLFGFFWAYARYPRRQIDPSSTPECFRRPDSLPGADALPHLVVVQSESFFDPRQWQPALHGSVLDGWDRLCAESAVQGRLEVPAWGANTVRSEAAFLTGLSGAALGMHQFNPYRQLARQPVPNLVRSLKRSGYRTVAVHPYPASFYLRHKVMPHMGFDDFITLDAFDDDQPAEGRQGDRDGQYIADAVLASKVDELLQASIDQPLMVFVITMENHGPLHLERPDAAWRDKLPPPLATSLDERGRNELAVYLRHLANADSMASTLANSLIRQDRQGILCFYGDHVPIMARSYRALGEPDGRSDYLIWTTATSSAGPAELLHDNDIPIDHLAATLWDTVTGMAKASTRQKNACARKAQRSKQQDELQEQE